MRWVVVVVLLPTLTLALSRHPHPPQPVNILNIQPNYILSSSTHKESNPANHINYLKHEDLSPQAMLQQESKMLSSLLKILPSQFTIKLNVKSPVSTQGVVRVNAESTHTSLSENTLTPLLSFTTTNKTGYFAFTVTSSHKPAHTQPSSTLPPPPTAKTLHKHNTEDKNLRHSVVHETEVTLGADSVNLGVTRERYNVTTATVSLYTPCLKCSHDNSMFFWSWEAILLVSLPVGWLLVLAVLCCLTRTHLGKKLLRTLGLHPHHDHDHDHDPELGHGIGNIDGSPGMRRSVEDTEENMMEMEEEDNMADEEGGQVTEADIGDKTDTYIMEDVDLNVANVNTDKTVVSESLTLRRCHSSLAVVQDIADSQRRLRALSRIQEEGSH